MLRAIEQRMRSRFQAWMQKRLPAARSITLNQQRTFIFPSRAGLGFLFLLLIILLGAINYQNNMVFALAFLLTGTFVVTILHTYVNFSGLCITAMRAHPAFAGEAAGFDLKISRSGKRRYFDIALSWPQSEVSTVSLDDVNEVVVHLHLPAPRRGLLRPPRLLVESYYPLGLLRCWSWLTLDIEAVIYPKPVAGEWRPVGAGDSEEGDVVETVGSDDFYAFRSYQPGDPLKHVAWKSFAKGQTLQTKQFVSFREHRYWLSWDEFSGDTEGKLSVMCYWALKLEQQGEEYGLRLPGVEIDPATGEAHCRQVLTELARFGIPRP